MELQSTQVWKRLYSTVIPSTNFYQLTHAYNFNTDDYNCSKTTAYEKLKKKIVTTHHANFHPTVLKKKKRIHALGLNKELLANMASGTTDKNSRNMS